jgi:hypothetical protein
MNIGYTIYQAERTMSPAERRAADTQRGELAAALSRRLRRSRKQVPATALAPQATHPAVPDCACALLAAEPDCAPVG